MMRKINEFLTQLFLILLKIADICLILILFLSWITLFFNS